LEAEYQTTRAQLLVSGPKDTFRARHAEKSRLAAQLSPAQEGRTKIAAGICSACHCVDCAFCRIPSHYASVFHLSRWCFVVCQSSTSALSRLEQQNWQSRKERDLSHAARSGEQYATYAQQAHATAAYDSYSRTAAASYEHGASREAHRTQAESNWRWQRDDIASVHPAAARAASSAYLAPSAAATAGAYTYVSRPFAHPSSSYAANAHSHAFLPSRTAAAAASAPFVPPYPLVHVNPYDSHIGVRFR